MNIRTVFNWLSIHVDGGQKAPQAKPIPGRTPKYTGDEVRWIAQTLKDHTPQQLKIKYGLWTLSLIGELLHREFGRSLSLASVNRGMRLLRFSSRKPLYQFWQQDTVLVEAWQKETYPKVRPDARQVGATIDFTDEPGIRSDYHTGTIWSPCGEAPVVTLTGSRFSLNMLPAVGPRRHFRFIVHERSANATVFRVLLKRLFIWVNQVVVVVMDGHHIHTAKLVTSYVESLAGQLKLINLPPYAPQINPDEQVGADVKSQFTKHFAEGKENMMRVSNCVLHRIQKLHNPVRPFFKESECQNAGI